MHIRQNISIRPFNTFGIDVLAEYFTDINKIDDLLEMGKLPMQKHILGGGSNILLTQNVNGLVLHNKLKGVELHKEDDDFVWLKVNSGEIWHYFVMYAVNNGWGGIENLSLIPGTVGATPMQNIGAYGVEAKETIESVTFWHWQEQAFFTYNNNECEFSYRDSVFKRTLKDKVFITSVVYKLQKHPTFNTSYGAISSELEQMKISKLSLKAISQAVVNIRQSKLPDPTTIGNAGSFFKNPTISIAHYLSLKENFPIMPSYPVNTTTVKVPAGWLIEHCGWKGYRIGDTGVHTKQALVLVNYGHASGEEIWALSDAIVQSVFQQFGIDLEREVQVW